MKDLFSLMQGRLKNNLVAVHKYLKNNYKDEELEQTSLQQQEKFCFGIRRNFFTMKTEKHWNKVPRRVVESPFSEIFKA